MKINVGGIRKNTSVTARTDQSGLIKTIAPVRSNTVPPVNLDNTSTSAFDTSTPTKVNVDKVQNGIAVVAKTNQSGLIQTGSPITLKNLAGVVGSGGQSNIDELRELLDVDAASVSNNATVVYNTDVNKYVVKQMDLDGGSF